MDSSRLILTIWCCLACTQGLVHQHSSPSRMWPLWPEIVLFPSYQQCTQRLYLQPLCRTGTEPMALLCIAGKSTATVLQWQLTGLTSSFKKKKRLVSLPKHFLFSEWWWSHEFVQFHMLKPKAAVINKKTSNGQRSARTRRAAMLYAMPVHGKPTCKWLTHWFRSQAKHSTHCHVHWIYFFGCPLLPSSWKMHGSSVWFTM